MDQAQRTALRQKIEATILEMEDKIRQLDAATQPISPENSIGRVSRMDAINNKSVAEAALRTAKKKMGQLKIALGKIDAPDFGSCSRCKRAINPKRLMFLPESTLCIHCA